MVRCLQSMCMINMYRPLSSVGPEDPREDYVGDKNLYLGGDALHQQRLDELYSNGCKNTERSVGRYARAVCCCKGGPVFPVRLFIHDVGMTETWTQVSTKKRLQEWLSIIKISRYADQQLQNWCYCRPALAFPRFLLLFSNWVFLTCRLTFLSRVSKFPVLVTNSSHSPDGSLSR